MGLIAGRRILRPGRHPAAQEPWEAKSMMKNEPLEAFLGLLAGRRTLRPEVWRLAAQQAGGCVDWWMDG